MRHDIDPEMLVILKKLTSEDILELARLNGMNEARARNTVRNSFPKPLQLRLVDAGYNFSPVKTGDDGLPVLTDVFESIAWLSRICASIKEEARPETGAQDIARFLRR